MVVSVGEAVRDGGEGRLIERLAPCRRLLVLTGAGCSTGAGIPDYRDEQGAWKRPPPVQWRDFLRSDMVRRRYWARSLVGWPQVAAAEPVAAHRALAALERNGRLHWLITQNVDGLHQRAGNQRVTDLHGRLDRVLCLDCGALWARTAVQEWLLQANPDWARLRGRSAPDGDAELDGVDFSRFRVPACPSCGGVLKPDVVFFGETVGRVLVDQCLHRLRAADALLVVGSSLMVWSGYRFVRWAAQAGVPVYIVNRGASRGDREAALVVRGDCNQVLPALVAGLTRGQ